MENKLEKIIERQDDIIDQQSVFIKRLLELIERIQNPPYRSPPLMTTTDTIPKAPFEVTCKNETL